MKSILKTLCLALVITCWFPTKNAIAEPNTVSFTPPDHLTVEQRITKYATVYATPATPLVQVAKCESGFSQGVVGAAGEIGIFQYKKSTWEGMTKQFGGILNINSADDQAKLTAWVFKNHPEYRSQWSCSRIMGILK